MTDLSILWIFLLSVVVEAIIHSQAVSMVRRPLRQIALTVATPRMIACKIAPIGSSSWHRRVPTCNFFFGSSVDTSHTLLPEGSATIWPSATPLSTAASTPDGVSSDAMTSRACA